MIRKAKLQDETQINRLGELLNPNYAKLFNLNDILSEKYSWFYVYEDNNKIKGFLHATVLDETVDIVNIVVDPSYRKQKIASNLFDTLMSELSENVKLITLEVKADNYPAINLYQKFGFEIVNIRKNYYPDGDAFLMGRRL